MFSDEPVGMGRAPTRSMLSRRRVAGVRGTTRRRRVLRGRHGTIRLSPLLTAFGNRLCLGAGTKSGRPRSRRRGRVALVRFRIRDLWSRDFLPFHAGFVGLIAGVFLGANVAPLGPADVRGMNDAVGLVLVCTSCGILVSWCLYVASERLASR